MASATVYPSPTATTTVFLPRPSPAVKKNGISNGHHRSSSKTSSSSSDTISSTSSITSKGSRGGAPPRSTTPVMSNTHRRFADPSDSAIENMPLPVAAASGNNKPVSLSYQASSAKSPSQPKQMMSSPKAATGTRSTISSAPRSSSLRPARFSSETTTPLVVNRPLQDSLSETSSRGSNRSSPTNHSGGSRRNNRQHRNSRRRQSRPMAAATMFGNLFRYTSNNNSQHDNGGNQIVFLGMFNSVARIIVQKMQQLIRLARLGGSYGDDDEPLPQLPPSTTADDELSRVTTNTTATVAKEDARVQGIPNYGQTCFMNVVLQCLASLDDTFLQYLKHVCHQIEMEREQRRHTREQMSSIDGDEETEELETTLSEILLELLLQVNGLINLDRSGRQDPRTLLQKVAQCGHGQFGSRYYGHSRKASLGRDEQHDAQELLQAILDVVTQEAAKYGAGKYRRPTKRNTGGTLSPRSHYSSNFSAPSSPRSAAASTLSDDGSEYQSDEDTDSEEEILTVVSGAKERRRQKELEFLQKQSLLKGLETPTGALSPLSNGTGSATPVGLFGFSTMTLGIGTPYAAAQDDDALSFPSINLLNNNGIGVPELTQPLPGGMVPLQTPPRYSLLNPDQGQNGGESSAPSSPQGLGYLPSSLNGEASKFTFQAKPPHSPDEKKIEDQQPYHHLFSNGSSGPLAGSAAAATMNEILARAVKSTHSVSSRTTIRNNRKRQEQKNTSLPLTGWMGSALRCSKCRHVRPIQNSCYLSVPLVPTAVTGFLGNGSTQDTPSHPGDPPVKNGPSAEGPPCTLETCLTQFTSVERVSDVECRNCTYQRVKKQFQEEVAFLADGIKHVRARAERNKQKPKNGRTTPMSSVKLDDEDPAKLLSIELAHAQQQLTTLETSSPDDDDNPALEALLKGAANDDDIPHPQPLERCDAFKRLMLTRLPNVLSFHIQRRFYDPRTNSMSKTTQHVHFPEYLEVGSYCAYSGPRRQQQRAAADPSSWAGTSSSSWSGEPPSSSNRSSSAHNSRYRLLSVMEHRGGAFYGHYVSFRRQLGADNRDQWLFISDDVVRPVDWEAVQKCQAYMLFYEKVEPSEE